MSRQCFATIFKCSVSNNALFVSHYSKESKSPRCEKSLKPRRRLIRQDDGFMDLLFLDEPHIKVTRYEASDSFSGVKPYPFKQIVTPRKQYMTKRRREAALLTSAFSQTLAAVPQTNASFEGLFKDMQIGNPASDFSTLVTSVNKSNAIESAKNATDTNNYRSVAVASDFKGIEKRNVTEDYTKPLKKLLHSSVVPSNKSSDPPRAPVIGQQTRNELFYRTLTANSFFDKDFQNFPLSNDTRFLNMSVISNETGNTSDESDDTADSVSSAKI